MEEVAAEEEELEPQLASISSQALGQTFWALTSLPEVFSVPASRVLAF